MLRAGNTLEFESKREAGVVASVFSFHVIGEVAYLSSFPDPAHIFIQGVALGVHQRFHTHVVQTVRFQQIYDIEAVLYILPSVGH